MFPGIISPITASQGIDFASVPFDLPIGRALPASPPALAALWPQTLIVELLDDRTDKKSDGAYPDELKPDCNQSLRLVTDLRLSLTVRLHGQVCSEPDVVLFHRAG
jgi:hypothetical protein